MSQLKINLNEILRQKEELIVPGNIKKDVTVFGVTGTLDANNIIEFNNLSNVSVVTESGKNILVLSGNISSYTELEYIESTGTQYINTGVMYESNVSYRVEMTCKFTDLSNMTHSGWDAGFAMGQNGAKLSSGFDPFGTLSINTEYTLIQTKTANADTSNLTCGSFSQDRSTSSLSTYATLPYSIFCMGSGNSYTSYMNIQLMQFKMYRNNTLVHDFIPVKRTSDNEICLYDKVTETFFTNAGTGNFLAGPEKGE